MADRNMKFYAAHYGKLVDKKIKCIVQDGDPEGFGPTFGLEFTDGTIAWIQSDEEGNGAGFLEIEDGGRP